MAISKACEGIAGCDDISKLNTKHIIKKGYQNSILFSNKSVVYGEYCCKCRVERKLTHVISQALEHKGNASARCNSQTQWSV